ncbi:MAG: transcriptional regulator [Myxococcota bacterium]
MKGYQREPDADQAPVGKLKPWEALVADAVANVIEFWNFKRSHGLVWALLYLRGRPMDAGEIQAELGLSKGGVSMGIRELEHWNVVRRIRAPGDTVWRYAAETDFLGMIGKVVAEREGSLVDSVARDLSRAEMLAADDPGDPAALERVKKMRSLAELVSAALRAFLHTANLDIHLVRHALTPVAAEAPTPAAPAKAPKPSSKTPPRAPAKGKEKPHERPASGKPRPAPARKPRARPRPG